MIIFSEVLSTSVTSYKIIFLFFAGGLPIHPSAVVQQVSARFSGSFLGSFENLLNFLGHK
jgi:hypothetical protein